MLPTFYLPLGCLAALNLLPYQVIAQSLPTAFGSPREGAAERAFAVPAAPRDVHASDGIYDKFVLIRWEPSENATQYKVFRADKPNSSSLQSLSNTWQKSTWLCDYSALPGVDYYYTVVASSGREVSPASQADKGFVKKKAGMANEEMEGLSSNEAYGDPQQVFLLIAELFTSKQEYRPGEPITISVRLQNIFDKASARTEVRYYLSKDAVLDWNDELLARKMLSSIQGNAALTLSEDLVLPQNLLPGAYHIIAVCSAEGAILGSKTDLTTFKIVE